MKLLVHRSIMDDPVRQTRLQSGFERGVSPSQVQKWSPGGWFCRGWHVGFHFSSLGYVIKSQLVGGGRDR